ncbi:MAG: 5-(carboxyamino)imidazole ribonucleotide mutase [bacterium]
MAKPKVGIIMGSDSDLEVMKEAANILKQFGLEYEMTVASIHRSPDLCFELAESMGDKGWEVIVAGAGGAAHLAGFMAAKTIIPIIAVPIDNSALKGIDSLLSIVQMPGGIPVATMAIGKAGAKNAGIMAVQILSLKYPELKDKLWEYKKSLAEGVKEKAKRLLS